MHSQGWLAGWLASWLAGWLAGSGTCRETEGAPSDGEKPTEGLQDEQNVSMFTKSQIQLQLPVLN